MSSHRFDADGIGPELALADVRVPPHVGDRLAAFYDTDERITDAREWAEAMTAAVREETGHDPEQTDMCTAADGPHTVEFADESVSYVCVLDPLIAVFLRGEPGTVRSKTPAGNEVVVDVGTDGATAAPAEAVVSFGVGETAPEPTLEAAYGQVCAFTHVFASSAAYERWDTGVNAATTSLSIEQGVAMARELVSAFA